MKFLSQRDPAWAAKYIGSSDLKIGQKGCTLTSISMLSDYFGCYMSPDAIAGHTDWFTKGGLVIWNKLDFKKMKFNWRYYEERTAAIMNALADPNKAVILEVNHGTHWVVAYSKGIFSGKDYWCIDPWTGKKCLVKKNYHNITGCAIFDRKH